MFSPSFHHRSSFVWYMFHVWVYAMFHPWIMFCNNVKWLSLFSRHLPCNYYFYYSLSYIFGFPLSPLFKEDTYSLCIFCGDPLPTGRIMRGPQVHPFTVSFFLSCACVCAKQVALKCVIFVGVYRFLYVLFLFSIFPPLLIHSLLRTGRERERRSLHQHKGTSNTSFYVYVYFHDYRTTWPCMMAIPRVIQLCWNSVVVAKRCQQLSPVVLSY